MVACGRGLLLPARFGHPLKRDHPARLLVRALQIAETAHSKQRDARRAELQHKDVVPRCGLGI